MPDPSFTALLLIVDRSASMVDSEIPVEDGIQLLLDFAALSAPHLTTVDLLYVHENMHFRHKFALPESVRLELDYDGASPLWDGIALGVLDLARRIEELPGHARPSRVSVFVVSSGVDNASRYFTPSLLQALIWKYTRLGWRFDFAGATRQEVLSGDPSSPHPDSTPSPVPFARPTASA